MYFIDNSLGDLSDPAIFKVDFYATISFVIDSLGKNPGNVFGEIAFGHTN